MADPHYWLKYKREWRTCKVATRLAGDLMNGFSQTFDVTGGNASNGYPAVLRRVHRVLKMINVVLRSFCVKLTSFAN